MPTVAQVLTKLQGPPATGAVYAGAVNATPVAGQPVQVALSPGGEVVGCFRLNATAYALNDPVLVLVHRSGSYILGKVTL